jgi:hypothetical protein
MSSCYYSTDSLGRQSLDSHVLLRETNIRILAACFRRLAPPRHSHLSAYRTCRRRCRKLSAYIALLAEHDGSWPSSPVTATNMASSSPPTNRNAPSTGASRTDIWKRIQTKLSRFSPGSSRRGSHSLSPNRQVPPRFTQTNLPYEARLSSLFSVYLQNWLAVPDSRRLQI